MKILELRRSQKSKGLSQSLRLGYEFLLKPIKLGLNSYLILSFSHFWFIHHVQIHPQPVYLIITSIWVHLPLKFWDSCKYRIQS